MCSKRCTVQNQQITLIVPGESPYITPNSAHILQTHINVDNRHLFLSVQQILNTS